MAAVATKLTTAATNHAVEFFLKFIMSFLLKVKVGLLLAGP